MSWIKLHRCLQQHWLWSDAERLRWWLDLLFMAAWKPRQVMHDSHIITLQRGQIIASVSLLCQKWQKNHQTVIRYLNTLEREGMIERKVMYRQTAIITICNYECYQGDDTDMIDTIADTQTNTQTSAMVDDQTDTQMYSVLRIKENSSTLTPKEKLKKESPRAPFSEPSPASVAAVTPDPSPVLSSPLASPPSFASQLNGNERWQASIAKKHNLQPHEVREQLDVFWLDVECRGATHRNVSDAKRHFTDWLAIQQEQNRRRKPKQPKIAAPVKAEEPTPEPQPNKEEAYRERMLGLIELIKKNPRSSCMPTLLAAYRSGALAKAGILWIPPGEQSTAADLIAADPDGRLAKIFNK